MTKSQGFTASELERLRLADRAEDASEARPPRGSMSADERRERHNRQSAESHERKAAAMGLSLLDYRRRRHAVHRVRYETHQQVHACDDDGSPMCGTTVPANQNMLSRDRGPGSGDLPITCRRCIRSAVRRIHWCRMPHQVRVRWPAI